MGPENLHFCKFPGDAALLVQELLIENYCPTMGDTAGFIRLASVIWQGAAREEIDTAPVNFNSGRQEMSLGGGGPPSKEPCCQQILGGRKNAVGNRVGGERPSLLAFRRAHCQPPRPPPRQKGSLWLLSEVSNGQVWSSPPWGSRATGSFPFASMVPVQSCLSRLGLFTPTLQPRGPACNFQTSVFPSPHVSHLDSSLLPPCLFLSQCSFPEIEFRQAPGKSEGSARFKLQLKIFLLDSSTLKRRACVLRISRQKGHPSPHPPSTAGLFQDCN